MMQTSEIQTIKQRFGIIGNTEQMNRAIDVAVQVAPTDLSVLVQGESGVGKEFFPQIIHQFSARKHGKYIAVNCGAIPEGTIDSELFGHIKGSFTGAMADRKGYFEEANGGTIFLDEVGELPLSTQVRLLRVLESGEYIRVGSSEIRKTNVRVVAATNLNMQQATQDGRFREDLYYRLNTVPIFVPPLRDRKEDIELLFRRFALDFSEKYNMPPIRLAEEAKQVLVNYRWNGNVRQLKNITEQISVIEHSREISAATLRNYLPSEDVEYFPALFPNRHQTKDFGSEREILYQILFDMRKDINDLKQLLHTTGTTQPVQNQTDISFSDLIKHRDAGVPKFAHAETVTPDIYTRQTRLQVIKSGGDMHLEGEITDLQLAPMAIAADTYAAETKVTIFIRVRFSNKAVPEEDFEKTYSAFRQFSSNITLNDALSSLIPEIVKEISEMIFNDTAGKW